MDVNMEQLVKRCEIWERSLKENRPKWNESGDFLKAMEKMSEKDPIARESENGIYTHESGVTFEVDTVRKTITLGDVSEGQRTISVRLSTGYTLTVNMNHLEDLAKCIDKFLPEDVKRILNAISAETHKDKRIMEEEEKILDCFEKISKQTKEEKSMVK